jgi:phage terminase large subunit
MISLTNIVKMEYTPVFKANKNAFDSGMYRVIANEGGSRSSKTYSLSQLVVLLAYQGFKISVCSASLPHLKRGARRDVLNVLKKLKIYNEKFFNKTDQIYNFPSGGYIEFFGIDNSGKVLGPGRDILWVNEANIISYENYRQLAIRTTHTIFIDYNPADEFSWVYDIADKEGNKKIVSTYKNNLKNLSKEQIAEIESYKNTDLNFWNVFGLGKRGTSEATIYKHWKLCTDMPSGEKIYGLDFGFVNPLALVEVTIIDNRVYARLLIYESGIDIENFESGNDKESLVERLKTFGISGKAPIYCDHDPGKISQLKKNGFNAIQANKDVENGILSLKARELYLHQTSLEMIKEFKSYKWKQDINGKILEGQPVKQNDHSCDAVRMAVHSHTSTAKPNQKMTTTKGLKPNQKHKRR